MEAQRRQTAVEEALVAYQQDQEQNNQALRYDLMVAAQKRMEEVRRTPRGGATKVETFFQLCHVLRLACAFPLTPLKPHYRAPTTPPHPPHLTQPRSRRLRRRRRRS